MKITQIRNATIVIEVQNHTILVDPMLSHHNALPRLRYFGSNRRNPLVALPKIFEEIESKINIAMITHCRKGHFDHLDRAGAKWLYEKQITTYCTERDRAYLQNKGINTKLLSGNNNAFIKGTVDYSTTQ